MGTGIRTVEMARKQLPRLSIDSSCSYRDDYEASPTSSVSSARASIATSFDTPSSAGIFHVLCLYDFKAGDVDQLSFKKNEVLDIVKQEDSGWWAALRENDHTVERLRRKTVAKEDVRVQDITERAYTTGALGTEYEYVSPGDAMRAFDWMPVGEHKPSPVFVTRNDLSPGGGFPSDVISPVFSPLILDRDSDSILTAEPEDDLGQTIEVHTKPVPYPPSPVTPMPKPPIKSKLPIHKRPIRSMSTPLPSTGHSPVKARSEPSNTSIVLNRNLRRRRPVLIDDSNSLSRLSTLFESSNVDEVDFLASSPVVAGSIEAYSPNRMARSHTPRLDKVKQITGEDEAQALYDAWATHDAVPWFLRSDSGSDELKLEFDGSVTAGTVAALVERLTSEPLKPEQGPQFRHAFLMTFKTFATPDEVLDLLLKRYDMKTPLGLSDAELDLWRTKKLLPTQKRVLGVFAVWMEHHRLVQDDPPVARRLQEFLSGIVEPAPNRVLAKQVMSVLERKTFDIPSSPKSAVSPTKKGKKSKSPKGDLFKMDPSAVAEHLCLYDHRLYSRIQPKDCFDYVKKQSRQGDASSLASFCATHDRVAAWVKSSILETEKVTKRADVVDFWVKVAEKCRTMNNFASLSAIVTALSSVVITRLSLTWAYVGRASHLDSLTKCNDPSGNFSAYRILQQAVDGACVPFVGMYLTDIIHINDQHLDNTFITANNSTTLVNFVKRQKWSDVVSAMLQHQGKQYPFVEVPATMVFIESNLTQAEEIDTDAFWSKSQEVQQSEIECADIRKGLEMAGF
ncbi:unnamed protein product [Somion occarium]|uniref:Ras GEF n=1 Tax=Somion occarium TaxID=3059160 RepID=A0ABP1CFB4_9APHY